MRESHRLPNGGVLTLQVGEKDMILPPDSGFKRESSGEGWAVDVYTDPAKAAEAPKTEQQKPTPSPITPLEKRTNK